jgi:lipid II:glycine glycyltransferase (peptidoglycan interpeptide bridge formation enzyme)
VDAVLALKKYLKSKGFAFALLEAEEGVKFPKFETSQQLLLPYSGHIQPQQTNIVRLGRSEEAIFMGMEGNYRRNIKKAIREGVTVSLYQFTSGNQHNKPVDAFYEVLQAIMANTKFLGRNLEYFQTIWNILGESGKARIFLAKWQNKVVGAYLVVNDNKAAYELYGGVTRAGRDIEAGYLLKWEAIRYYNNLGLKNYDHWGVAPKLADGSYDSKDELFQISKFKEGFGGEFVEFPVAKALVINTVKYKLFLAGNVVNKTVLKLKKRLKKS